MKFSSFVTTIAVALIASSTRTSNAMAITGRSSPISLAGLASTTSNHNKEGMNVKNSRKQEPATKHQFNAGAEHRGGEIRLSYGDVLSGGVSSSSYENSCPCGEICTGLCQTSFRTRKYNSLLVPVSFEQN